MSNELDVLLEEQSKLNVETNALMVTTNDLLSKLYPGTGINLNWLATITHISTNIKDEVLIEKLGAVYQHVINCDPVVADNVDRYFPMRTRLYQIKEEIQQARNKQLLNTPPKTPDGDPVKRARDKKFGL